MNRRDFWIPGLAPLTRNDEKKNRSPGMTVEKKMTAGVPDEASRSDAKIRDLDNEAAVSRRIGCLCEVPALASLGRDDGEKGSAGMTGSKNARPEWRKHFLTPHPISA